MPQGHGRLREDKPILTDIDLEVRRGEIVALLGGSGCGKSTLLRTITGLSAAARGRGVACSARTCTRSTTRAAARLLRRTGMAFQQDALFGSMSIIDNVALPLRELTKLPEPIICEMARMRLALVGLAGFEHRMPARMSGGQRKRAALARASILDPEIIFCDEPSAGLDPVVAAELDDTLLKFRDVLGITIVIVSHELDSIRAIADRAIMFGNGRALATGTIPELEQSRNEDVYHFFHARSGMSDQTQSSRRSASSRSSPGALLAMVLVVFGGLRFWKHHDHYYIDFDDSVMGLSEGTQVYFNGIKVGSVGEIKLDRGRPDDASASASTSTATRRSTPTPSRC